MKTFERLGLNGPFLQAIQDHGFSEPTPIQLQAVPPALAGRDLVGCAQTGTGKTVAFLLPSMQKLSGRKPRSRQPQMVVLAPTRELAIQIADEARAFAVHTPMRCSTWASCRICAPSSAECRTIGKR
jgi:ATP-dependent RNA helicase RhlE